MQLEEISQERLTNEQQITGEGLKVLHVASWLEDEKQKPHYLRHSLSSAKQIPADVWWEVNIFQFMLPEVLEIG